MQISDEELHRNTAKMERGIPVIKNGRFGVVVDTSDGEQTITWFTLEELKRHLTQRAPDEGYCAHKWSFPPEFCPVCNKRIPLIRLRG